MDSWLGSVVYLGVISAWITSIVMCINNASWALLFAVVFVPPVGVIHGFGLWIGVF